MSILSKDITTTIETEGTSGIPAIPATPGTSGSPAQPAYTTYEIESYTAIFYTITGTVVAKITGDVATIAFWMSTIGDSAHSVDVIENTVAVEHPAVPAVSGTPGNPGRPGISGTVAQLSHSLNPGWNTWARSVDDVPVGTFVQYSPSSSANGAFLGVGSKNKEGRNINTFSHAMITDVSGTRVFEYGVEITKLSDDFSGVETMRIVRQDDDSVTYLIINGSSTLVYSSETPMETPSPMYGYGMLYVSGDTISEAEITTGAVQYGSV